MEQPRCGVQALAGMVDCVSGQLSKRVARLPLKGKRGCGVIVRKGA